MSDDSAMNNWLPLTEASFCILLALNGPNHGYGIMQSVEAFTDGGISIGAGTLYTALAKFEKRGIIRRTPDSGRQKRYELTDDGRDLLALEIGRMARLVDIGRKMVASGGGDAV